MSPFFEAIAAQYGQAVLFLLLVVLVELLTGLASALRRGAFVWRKVGDFYLKSILPLVVGWVAVVILVEAALRLSVPPEWVNLFAVGGVWFYYLAALGQLAASIYANLKEIQLPPPGARG